MFFTCAPYHEAQTGQHVPTKCLLPTGQCQTTGVYWAPYKEGDGMNTVVAFLRRYNLVSLIVLEGVLALASIARSVISSWAGQTAAARRASLRLLVKK